MTGAGLVAVVAAMREELEPLRTLAGGDGAPVLLAGVPCFLLVTGEGAANARRELSHLVRTMPIRAVLGLGLAGAVSPGLRPGAIVVADRVGSPGMVELQAPAWLVHAARVAHARVWTCDEILCSAADKRAVEKLFPAQPALPTVVDLESYAWADVARSAGVPWGILRSVSDAADENLPGFLAHCRDATGAIRRSRVVTAALAQPRHIPKLIALRGRMRSGASALARTALSWLPHFVSAPDVVSRAWQPQ